MLTWLKTQTFRSFQINQQTKTNKLSVGIDRRFLLGLTVGSCWDRLSALAGIDRRLLLGSIVGSEKRSGAQPHTANRGRRK
jgi:hypothetical protein